MAAVTLAESKKNTQDDIDLAVIDEFIKSDWFLSNVQFDDAVNPAGGGGTLTYGYTRLVTERGASIRDYGSDMPAEQAAVRQRYSVDLVPIDGTYKIDRDLAGLGPAASNEVAFQSQQAIKAVRAKFNETMIDGARQTGGNGFDGLDAALAGSTTEVATGPDLSQAAVSTEIKAHDAIDALDEFLSLLNGTPTALVTNAKGVLRLRSLARRAGYYEREKDEFGRQVESYGGVPFVDLGAKSGSSAPVIPTDTTTTPGSSLVDIYAVRLGLDGFHGVFTNGGNLVKNWLPDFDTAGPIKPGEVAMGPIALALKATKAAGVLRNVKVA